MAHLSLSRRRLLALAATVTAVAAVAVPALAAGPTRSPAATPASTSAARVATAPLGSRYQPVAPCRVANTLTGVTTCAGASPRAPGAVTPAQPLTVGVPGAPAGATAVAVVLTATDASTGLVLDASAAGAPASATTATLSVGPGQVPTTITAVVPLSAADAIALTPSAGSVQVVVDLSGWFVANGGNPYRPLPGCRLLDTRTGQGGCAGAVGHPRGALAAGQTLTVQAGQVGGVPADATAVAVSVTAISPTVPTFLTGYAGGSPRPATDSLWAPARSLTSGLLLLPLGDGGKLSLFNESGSVNLVIDLEGYVAAQGPDTYLPLTRCRLLDTRHGTTGCSGAAAWPAGRLGAHATADPRVVGVDGIPASTDAVVVTVTEVSAAPGTVLTTSATGCGPPPATSTLDTASAAPAMTTAVIPVGPSGRVNLSVLGGSTDLVVDLVGAFAGPGVLGGTSTSLVDADWSTYHGDVARDGNAQCTPAPGALGVAWHAHLDGAVYGQPLVVGGTLVAATENDTVYGLDAATGTVVWSTHLAAPEPSAPPLPCGDIFPLGITSTPVYDPTSGLVFVVAEELGGTHWLYGVSPLTGAVSVTTEVEPPVGQALATQQRAALALVGDRIYITYGGLAGDCSNYIGSVVSVTTAGTGRITYAVPTAREGGIWAPGGPSYSHGRLYVAVGNGATTATGAPYDGSDAVLALSPTTLGRLDYFAPSDWAHQNANDQDLGSMTPPDPARRLRLRRREGGHGVRAVRDTSRRHRGAGVLPGGVHRLRRSVEHR